MHFFLALRNEAPVGFLVGSLIPHYFNPALIVLSQVLWWVNPEARMSRAPAALLDAYQALGRERAHWIQFSRQEHTPIRDASLARRGFRLVERTYLEEVR